MRFPWRLFLTLIAFCCLLLVGTPLLLSADDAKTPIISKEKSLEDKSILETRLSGYREKTIETREEVDLASSSMKMARGLAFVLGILFLGSFLYKKFGKKAFPHASGERKLQILEKIALSPKANLVLVRFQDKHLVLAVTDAQVTQISTESDALAEADFGQVEEESCSSISHSG